MASRQDPDIEGANVCPTVRNGCICGPVGNRSVTPVKLVVDRIGVVIGRRGGEREGLPPGTRYTRRRKRGQADRFAKSTCGDGVVVGAADSIGGYHHLVGVETCCCGRKSHHDGGGAIGWHGETGRRCRKIAASERDASNVKGGIPGICHNEGLIGRCVNRHISE